MQNKYLIFELNMSDFSLMESECYTFSTSTFLKRILPCFLCPFAFFFFLTFISLRHLEFI